MTERKRFYKKVTITRSDHKFEINLDSRKLKTPKGNVFFTYNEALALIVANEWDSQHSYIKLNEMHLTSLTNTAIDNPINFDDQTIANNIFSFIESDTLCFRINEPKELSNLQNINWNPIIVWFEKRFDCKIPITETVHLNPICETTKQTIYRHLCSHNRWSLLGLLFATENLKSLILSLALTHRIISVNSAVRLSRLEEDFQIEKWGKVEETHDLDLYALRARVSAAIIFYFLNCEIRHFSQKGDKFSQTIKSVV